MMLHIPDVLTQDQVADARRLIDAAEWVDGAATAGFQSAEAKNNLQLPETEPAAREVGATIQAALARNLLFISAALPLKIFPPLFNRYGPGQAFDTHVDNAMRQLRGTDFRIRTDLSATLFLSDPESYDGGELAVEDTYGVHEVKLPAGDLILYPASSLHQVKPITRGERVASFFWLQSMVREDAARTMLFQMDTAIQTLALGRGQRDPAIIQLTAVYHNLLRRWGDS